MKRAWFLVFALSLGLNAGLLYVSLSRPDSDRSAGGRFDTGGERRDAGGARQDGPPRPDDFATVIRRHLDRMTRDLHLEERQRAAIGAVHEALLPRILAERTAMDSLRREVTAAYARSTVDPAELRSIVLRVSLAQGRIDSLVTEAMLGEAAVLTFDQRQKYMLETPWGHPLAPPDRSGKEPPGQPPQGPQPRRDLQAPGGTQSRSGQPPQDWRPPRESQPRADQRPPREQQSPQDQRSPGGPQPPSDQQSPGERRPPQDQQPPREPPPPPPRDRQSPHEPQPSPDRRP